jgi:RimJ/RimL family protein N-acetyltransferase
MPRPVPTLRGELIAAVPAEPARDASGYLELYRDQRIREHVGEPPLRTLAEAEAELRRLAGIATISLWLLRLLADHTIVGRFFLDRTDIDGAIVVGEGVRVAPAWWRRGVSKDARRLMLRYAFDELGAARCVTKARVANENMIRSALHHGFARSGVEAGYETFAMTRERYLELRQRA